jgi:hypothetical protein
VERLLGRARLIGQYLAAFEDWRPGEQEWRDRNAVVVLHYLNQLAFGTSLAVGMGDDGTLKPLVGRAFAARLLRRDDPAGPRRRSARAALPRLSWVLPLSRTPGPLLLLDLSLWLSQARAAQAGG